MCTKSFSDRLRLHFQLFSTPVFPLVFPTIFCCFCCTSAVCINVYISMCRRKLRSLLFFHIFWQVCSYGRSFGSQHSARSPIASWTVCGKLEAKCSISIKFSKQMFGLVAASWRYFRIVLVHNIFETIFAASLALCMPCSMWRLSNGVCIAGNIVLFLTSATLSQAYPCTIFGSFFSCSLMLLAQHKANVFTSLNFFGANYKPESLDAAT